MSLRFVMPHGGYGLGNDLIPWAKGFLLSEEIGAHLLHPAWALNPREYGRYFGTSARDALLYRVLVRCLPRYAFTETIYREIGENDFAKACRAFAERHGLFAKRAFIVTITGHWGAFEGLDCARHFVRQVLGNARGSRENLLWLERQLSKGKLRIAVHIRRGDFHPPIEGNEYENVLNTAIPLSWYSSVCRSLVDALGAENLQFVVASDGSLDELGGFIEEFDCVFTSSRPDPDCSDLLALASGDLLVCSMSTYSIWAAILSEGPYIWFAPQLERAREGRGLKWIRSLAASHDTTRAHGASEIPRGTPMKEGDLLPGELCVYLRTRLSMKSVCTDLVRGGLVAAASA